MCIFKCEFKSLSDLIKAVVYTDINNSIHVIYFKEDANTSRKVYFASRKDGNEYYYCRDPDDFVAEGLFLIDISDDFEIKNIRRVYKLILFPLPWKRKQYKDGKMVNSNHFEVYVIVIKVENFMDV